MVNRRNYKQWGRTTIDSDDKKRGFHVSSRVVGLGSLPDMRVFQVNVGYVLVVSHSRGIEERV